MSAPLPPRLSHFADPVGDVVWAAVSALPPGDQQMLFDRLRDHLGDALLTERQAKPRVHRAIEGLRHAAELLGHSPSVPEYRRLRVEHPAAGLPPDGTVRSALGSGTWNDCLRLARLDDTADGDVLILALGPRLTAAECLASLRECAQDLGVAPSATMYRTWAGRPEVRQRPGRRPFAINPIVRLFGSFGKGLVAAGLIDGEASPTLLANGVVRVRGWRISDELAAAALEEVRERVGHVPRSTEYGHVRELIIAESASAGHPRTIPAVPTLLRKYGSWNATLTRFGMEPFEGRFDPKPFEPRRHNTLISSFDERSILRAIREAAADTGKDAALTLQQYVSWRRGAISDSIDETGSARRLPAPETIRAHLGTWTRARRHAFQEQK